jgi:hypothetical protein
MKSRRHRSPRADTMKCIRLVGQGVPVRLRNAEADKIVRVDKDGEYCTKRVFKDYGASQNAPPSTIEASERAREGAGVAVVPTAPRTRQAKKAARTGEAQG